MTANRKYSILLICGSLRTDSVNAAVLKTAAQLGAGEASMVAYLGMADLPHFDPNFSETVPPSIAELRNQIAAASALLFSTPEYAGAMPGVLKTLLEWTVGGSEISGKPTGWINPSTGPTQAAATYASLNSVLGYTGAMVIPSACVNAPVRRDQIGATGTISDPAVRGAIGYGVSALLASAASLT